VVAVIAVADVDGATLAAACADDAAGVPEMTDELAAMAAAAIASGAVALPDAGIAAGTPVSATGAGIATATAFGVVTADAACSTEAARSVEARPVEATSGEEWIVEVSPEDGFAFDFAEPAFEAPDFAPGCATALAMTSGVSSEDCLAVPLRSSAVLPAVWSDAAALRDPLLSEVAGASPERRCGTGCSGAVEAVRSLPVSIAVLLSTSAPKLSFPCDGSGLAGRDDAP
jgi:hypothetical protein